MASSTPHPAEGGFAALVWIDLEMSGLDPDTCRVLEIATVVTDGDLSVLGEGPDLVIHQPAEVLDAMDDWNTKHHADSGLTQAVRESRISLEAAERQTLDFLSHHCAPGKSPLCGNSIGQDRLFINKYMKDLAEYVHYRSIDVTSIKELSRRWYPKMEPPAKKESHRALDDILESIEELRFYRQEIFKKT